MSCCPACEACLASAALAFLPRFARLSKGVRQVCWPTTSRSFFARRSTTRAKQLGQPGQRSVGIDAISLTNTEPASLVYLSGYLVLPDLPTRPEDRAVGNWGENPDVPHGGIAGSVYLAGKACGSNLRRASVLAVPQLMPLCPNCRRTTGSGDYILRSSVALLRTSHRFLYWPQCIYSGDSILLFQGVHCHQK